MIRRLGDIVIGLIVAVCSYAVPAYRGPIQHVQTDGTTITLYQHGDEHFHYFTNANGQWMEQDEQGNYRIVPALNEQEIAIRRAAKSIQQTGVDRLLSPRGPVILVSFADLPFTSTHDEMNDWANGDNYTYNGATGSVRQYFSDVSYGQYDLQLDIFGPYTMQNNAAYYGGDSYSDRDTCVNKLIVEACKAAATDGADFSQYDSNNDGYVDWVVILYAGRSQAEGGPSWTIWPHQFELYYTGSTFQLNGKYIDHYCVLNEINSSGNRVGIGTFVHEFSHIMGLPDLYETTGQGNWKTNGQWDVMDYGPYNNDGNTPPAYSAYERWFMGWLTPTLLNRSVTVSVPDLNESPAAGIITTSGTHNLSAFNPNPNSYYLVENRQQTGWDTYLPGHGMLLTHITYSYTKWLYNSVNNTENQLGVDIIEADGLAPKYKTYDRDNGFFGKAGDAFPTGATTYEGIQNFKISTIVERNKTISFNLRGGGEVIPLSLDPTRSEQKSSIKWMQNGQILIQRGEAIYDLSGKRIY